MKLTYFHSKRAARHAVLVASLVICGASHADVTYSGRAFAVNLKLVNPSPNVLTFSDTGDLPPQGGSLSATLLTALVGTATLSSHTLTASTSGVGGVATSSASQQNLSAFTGQPAQVTASVVRSDTRADCGGVQGSSVVTNLTFGGSSVTVTGQPNQTISIPSVATLIINEQVVSGTGTGITVNALHLFVGTGEELVLSSSHSDVECFVSVRPETWGGIKSLYR